jgi:hypothetical protein
MNNSRADTRYQKHPPISKLVAKAVTNYNEPYDGWSARQEYARADNHISHHLGGDTSLSYLYRQSDMPQKIFSFSAM